MPTITRARTSADRRRVTALTPAARHCRQKFLEFFPEGFRDETYVETERAYKWQAHQDWQRELGRATYTELLARGAHREIADRALRVESRTNFLFSFEKIALRDALRTEGGADAFATGLHRWVYGTGPESARFSDWCDVVAGLPRYQTRVLTWPVVTVFGFISRPKVHVLLKPNVTRAAAAAYDVDFAYRSRPQWDTYSSLLEFARRVRRDQSDLGPRDMIDAQSFIWTQGSAEYD